MKKIKAKYKEFMKVYPLNLQSLIDEIWADIEGYEGHYQISNYGRTKSLKNGKEIILRPLWTQNGYLKFSLCLGSKHKNFSVHVLVANAFIANPENLPEINHLDGDKFNGHVSNLEFSTRSENNKHAFKNGLNKQKKAATILRLNLPTKKPLGAEKFIKLMIKNLELRHWQKNLECLFLALGDLLKGKTYKDA